MLVGIENVMVTEEDNSSASDDDDRNDEDYIPSEPDTVSPESESEEDGVLSMF